MRLIYGLYFLLPLIEISSQQKSHVVTEYDSRTIGNYFIRVQNYTNGNMSKPFSGQNLNEYCHVLRKSRKYRSVNVNSIRHYNVTPHVRHIHEQQLKDERAELDIRYKQFHIEHSANPQKLPYFKCLDFDGDYRWFVTPAFIPNSTFLFVLDPRFNFLQTREVQGEGDILPTLSCIIDEPAAYTFDSLLSSSDQLIRHKFPASLKSSTDGRDELCNLDSVIQFRLCAIGVDTIRHNAVHGLGENVTSQSYYTQTSNYHYRHETPDHLCPLIELKQIEVSHRMLNCSMFSNYRISHQFYLTLNARDTTKMFLLFTSESINYPPMFVEEIEVPLLKHLQTYKQAL